MKNIIAYSMEKLYKDLEEADELFLSSGMKDMELYEKQLAEAEERLLQSTWQPFTAIWIVCCVRIFPELKNIPSRGMINASW